MPFVCAFGSRPRAGSFLWQGAKTISSKTVPDCNDLSQLTPLAYLEWVIEHGQDPLRKLVPNDTFYEEYELRIKPHLRGVRCVGVRKVTETYWRLGRRMSVAVHKLLNLHMFDGMYFLTNTNSSPYLRMFDAMESLKLRGVTWQPATPGVDEVSGRFKIDRSLPKSLERSEIIRAAEAARKELLTNNPVPISSSSGFPSTSMASNTQEMLAQAQHKLGDVVVTLETGSDYRLTADLVPVKHPGTLAQLEEQDGIKN